MPPRDDGTWVIIGFDPRRGTRKESDMSRRWHPRGGGWIRVLDHGSCVAWLRPEPSGGCAIAYYGPHECKCDCDDPWTRCDDLRDIWVVTVPRGSWLPWQMCDKPRRIRDAETNPEPGTRILVKKTVHQSDRGHKAHRPRGYKRFGGAGRNLYGKYPMRLKAKIMPTPLQWAIEHRRIMEAHVASELDDNTTRDAVTLLNHLA